CFAYSDSCALLCAVVIFFFQAEDGIRDFHVTGVQTCALPIYLRSLVHARVGGIDVLLRYYDPRITRPWLEHETTSQRDLLLGPIRRIRLPDDTPETCLERMSQPQPARYNDTPWVTLSQAQLEHMSQARLGEIQQRLLLHVRNFHPACLHNLGPKIGRAHV